jgi:branched-chain amino acid transport system permease protein
VPPATSFRKGLAHAGGIELIAIVATLVALGIAPYVLDEYAQQVLFRLLIGLVLAEAWNLLGGYTGLVSLGTSSAVGLGGYVLVGLLNHTRLALPVALALAAVAGAALAAAAAPALLRLRGLYFTVGTLALAEVLRLLMVNVDRFGGATGLVLDRDPPELNVLVHVATVLLVVAVCVQTLCSRTRASVLLRAVRDDEDVASQLGVRAFRVKLLAFATASALMAAAGGVQALKLGAIEPYGMFGLRWSVDTLSMVIIGGLGSRLGPPIGAAVVILSGEWLADYPEAHLALTGALLILTMRFAPRGLAGLLNDLVRRFRPVSAERT